MVDTAQKRTKIWIDTYWTATDVLKDNGIIEAATISAYDWPDYPLARVFSDKAVNGIVSIGQARSEALIDSDHYPFAYLEHIPITLCAVDAYDVTGIKLLGQMEAELRSIHQNHPLGSIRRQSGAQPKTERIGSFFLFSVEYELEYKRDLT
jgi:hypothetical protein